MVKRIIWLTAIPLAAGLIWSGRSFFVEELNLSKQFGSKKIGQEENDIDQKMLFFSIDGRSTKEAKQWHLEGSSAKITEEAIYLKELEATTYGEDVLIKLTSDTGIYRKIDGEVELKGNVKVTADDGTVLTTNYAKWIQKTKNIFTNTVVHIKRENMTAIGRGGRADSRAKEAVLEKDVVVTIDNTKVVCDGPLVVKYNDNKAIFYNNVRIKDKDGILFADMLTVSFDRELQKASEIMAEGNVKIKRGNSYTISEKAIYTDGTKSAKLLGNPKIIIDPEEISRLENVEEIKKSD